MRIPVFVSAPSPNNLNDEQEKSAKLILDRLKSHKLSWRALGRSDYPHELPLREVLRMVRHCSGGIILGFEQTYITAGEEKRGTPKQKAIAGPVPLPTPWNQIEAGILFAAKLPILIFREPGIAGGVFDVGTTELFVHEMPKVPLDAPKREDLDDVFRRWAGLVQGHYYGD
jgi:hypothetical protein